MGIAILKNKSNVDITYTLNWESGLLQNDVIKPNEVVEINCGDEKATICHRSDGGAYGICPVNSRNIESGDKYFLLENGEYQD